MQDVYLTEMRLLKVCMEMEKRGILLDVDYCKEALSFEQLRTSAFRNKFKELTGKEFSDSRKVFKEIFDEHKIKYGLTKKGNPSFDSETLEKIDHEIASTILKVRYHEKRMGTYYQSFLYFRDGNNIIHPSMNQAGTVTGRFSYSNPNCQNIPKEDEDDEHDLPFHVRGCFIPRGLFVAMDYEQQEYRVMLDYAGEMNLIKEVNNGADVHEATARLVGCSRKQAKTLNFAILYGAGSDKIAAMLGATSRESSEMREAYFRKLPKVRRLIERIKQVGETRGYIINGFGRRYYINHFSESYRLPNHLIQGTCADICKRAMVRISETPNHGMVLQVHDELLFDVEDTKNIESFRKIMEESYTPRNGMLMSVSPSYSFKRWGFRAMKEGLPCESQSLKRSL